MLFLRTQQVLDGQTLREWMLPVYVAQDRTGYGFVWELMQGGHYTFLTKGGSIFGYQSEMFLLVSRDDWVKDERERERGGGGREREGEKERERMKEGKRERERERQA